MEPSPSRGDAASHSWSPASRIEHLDAQATLLEAAFPFREISLIIEADRRALDPVYGAHRWWARRPPALMRAILLASVIERTTSINEFWDAFNSADAAMSGFRVHDPFLGGGSTLVEAARLGATASGGDIDPLAVEIVRHELRPAPASAVREAGEALLEHLDKSVGQVYPAIEGNVPLHYFWLHEVTCPACASPGLLYRSLILARDTGRRGAVVRDAPLTVFCPIDLTVHELNDANRVELRHCGRRIPLATGTFAAGRYTCAACGTRSSHQALRTGIAPRRLIAVEETRSNAHRRLRPPTAEDRTALSRATELLAIGENLRIPTGSLTSDRHDPRPLSYGVETPRQLFSSRQLLVLGTANAWLRDADLTASIRRALTLAFSNALATNNKLCSYAVDYGRLSALFSVRGFSLPANPVELNPLHGQAGRGTLRHCIERVARSSSAEIRRYGWSIADAKPSAKVLTFDAPKAPARVKCVSALTPPETEIELSVFDPPYYDYIAYSELSEFYRSWLLTSAPKGRPLLPRGDDPAKGFGRDLGDCLQAIVTRLVPGGLLAFTYHSATPDAWHALGWALDHAGLAVTALWPVRSDGHMGHHSHPGNCEWDLVLTCRRRSETRPAEFGGSVAGWAAQVDPLTIGPADLRSMQLAVATVSSRFANIGAKDNG